MTQATISRKDPEGHNHKRKIMIKYKSNISALQKTLLRRCNSSHMREIFSKNIVNKGLVIRIEHIKIFMN
jgi:hypothetical protein